MNESLTQRVHPYMWELDTFARDAASEVKKCSTVEKVKILLLAKKLHKADPSAIDTAMDWATLSELDQAHYVMIALRYRLGLWYRVDDEFIF